MAHNVSFDRGMLEQHLGRVLSNPWIDTHDVAKIFLPTLTSYKLISIAGALDIHGQGFHRALQDAHVTAQVLLQLTQQACQLDPFTMQKIVNIFKEEDCGLTTLLQQIQTDIVAHAQIGKVYHNSQTPARTYSKRPLLDFSQTKKFFEPDGLMAQVNPSYQHRPQQLEMQKVISNAFLNESHGIIEAGTGTRQILCLFAASAALGL